MRKYQDPETDPDDQYFCDEDLTIDQDTDESLERFISHQENKEDGRTK